MSQIEPPPRIIEKFTSLWRDWLYFLWEFIQDHTGGSGPTPPATGSNWNAHGNTAQGGNTDPLLVKGGAFAVTSTTGTGDGQTPPDVEALGVHFAFIPDKLGAIRAGVTLGTTWQAANIGNGSVGFGFDPEASGSNSLAIGENPVASGNVSIAIGQRANATGASSTAVGTNCDSTARNTTAIGYDSDATANENTAVGYLAKAGTGQFATALGSRVQADNINTLAIGVDVQANASNSITIGTGANTFQKLINNNANTMWIGIKSNQPTLIVKNDPGGGGTTGQVGVVEQSPLSTLDIGGTVGFKYTYITSTPGGSTTIGASDQEYTFLVDIAGFSFGQRYDITLPNLSASSIDRRIYYFKSLDTGNTLTTGDTSRGLRLNPDASGDKIEYLSGGGASGKAVPGSLAVGLGTAITLIADAGNDTWWII